MSQIGGDPFATPEAERDPARRLRARLAAPVTVWTAASPATGPVGLTVSSVLVVEGEPPALVGLVGPLTDFHDAAIASRRFVVHVLAGDDRALAERFTGRQPGDPWDGLEVTPTEHGPLIGGVGTWAGCRLVATLEVGWSVLLRAELDRVEIGGGGTDRARHDDGGPLVHHRGRYQRLTSP